MIIDLTTEEYAMMITAVNTARFFYEQNGNTVQVGNCNHLTKILMVADKISFEVGKGITEGGWKDLEEFLRERKQMNQDESKVIKFPGR
ncbi:hypothetical protein [Desulforamulus aquiferis]|uniref:Uncharacterized protein n=1 Tax=Desulforamulus aquiferis TaxID=1397668 RepID=A0AAW7ZHJ4_9FIRM|nr:hypothetical protein [Desulforamulus aquiferis]MDO7788801.1 hypothetical protein [Desulforamulus aquiferis]